MTDRSAVSDRMRLDAAIVGYPPETIVVVAGAVVAMVIVLAIVAILWRRRHAQGRRAALDGPTSILEEMRRRLEDLPVLPQPATRLPKRLAPPPLPADSKDPITGEPDEAAYREWLKEWLVYAEQYGDETDSIQ